VNGDKRPPGRPRSEAARRAILLAALGSVAELGYGQTTIEGIAARAGVGKQTIYRWWPGKADIVLEASALKAETYVPVDDRGSYAAELRAFLSASFDVASNPDIANLLRALMAEAQIDPAFGERLRASFLQPRRHALAVITDRARHRGDLPGRPDAAVVADIIFGIVWYRILATHQPFDQQLTDDLLAILTT
jgi:AcrR family transcriptional regulator